MTNRSTTSKDIVSKRLKCLMAEHDIPLGELSKQTGIIEESLALKIEGQRGWLFRELITIIKQFGCSEIREVFPELYIEVLKTGYA